MWIKICGNTNLEDAKHAVESGADALGFVFADSPRKVTAAQVRHIVDKLPSAVEKYGVFVGSGFDEIVSVVSDCGLTGVQLHGSRDPELAFRLRAHFAGMAETLIILQVLHWTSGQTRPIDVDAQLVECSRGGVIDAVLVDSRTATAVGGTGTSFDWKGAQRTFLQAGPHLRLIAAGGLRPENVKQAVETLRPWGVDVSSGVEAVPGKKDPARVIAFVRTAREAEAALRTVPETGAVGEER